MKNPFHKKLEHALKILWQKSRYTSYFYQSVNFVESEDIPTIAFYESIFRPVLFYNYEFISSISVKNIIALLIHEMLHIVLRHEHRKNNLLNPYLQNLAQDMVVNSWIKENIKNFFSSSRDEEPIMELPEELPFIPDKFFRDTKIKDPRWDDIYRWLKDRDRTELSDFIDEIDNMFKELMPDTSKNTKSEQNGFSIFENKMEKSNHESDSIGYFFTDKEGKTLPTGSHLMLDDTASNRLYSHAKKIITMASKDPGTDNDRIFSSLASFMTSPVKPPMSKWIKQIKSEVDTTAHSNEIEYTYKKFNRRYFSQGIYSAGKNFKDMERVIVAIDVSASVTSNPGELEKAFGAVEALIPKYKIELVCMDDSLFIPKKTETGIEKDRNLSKKFIYKKGNWKLIETGSGGTTLFEPLFNSYMNGKRKLTLIVITDGYIHDIKSLKPHKNTLWLISSSRKTDFIPPFGKSFVIDMEAR